MPVAPNQGSTGGGDAVTLTGSHFTGTTSVRYGSRQAASFTVVSDTTTTTITPSGGGAVPVSVTTPGGTGVVGTFYYLPPPSFRLVPPPAGPLAGCNTVILTGMGLYTTSEVRFGTQAAVFTVDSDGQLTVTAPAAASAGPVGVTVTTRGGIASGITYTYLDAPSLTVVTLDSGPVDGGDLVVITGTAFSYTTGVTFGGTPVSLLPDRFGHRDRRCGTGRNARPGRRLRHHPRWHHNRPGRLYLSGALRGAGRSSRSPTPAPQASPETSE